MGVVIGFDYGLRRIGVATGQGLTQTATPLRALRARDGSPNWEEIATLIMEWKPSALVVGLPLNMDGSDSEMAVRVRKFGNRLHGRFGLPVYFADERLSTQEARALTGYQGRAGDQDGVLDAAAAACILERWLKDSV
ncbi:MAG: Holliday junction resolvase RuvX [Gammaproteobacteria bacterium]|nr:Holliday junction resolvase RuvX [Gammaproteobacteria bacterium]